MILNTANTLVLKTCFSYKYNYESLISINDKALSPSTETMFWVRSLMINTVLTHAVPLPIISVKITMVQSTFPRVKTTPGQFTILLSVPGTDYNSEQLIVSDPPSPIANCPPTKKLDLIMR